MSFRRIQQCLSSTVTHSLTVLVCLCAYLCCFVAYLWIEPLRTVDNTRVFLVVLTLHGICGGLLLLLVRRNTNMLKSPIWIIFVFICSRVLVFQMQPWLSDDVWRYLWDGALLANNINPYRFTPDSPELMTFRSTYSELYALLDYRNYSTIYPPLAQYVFALSTSIGEVWGNSIQEKLLVWKGVLVVSEGIGLWFIWKTQRAFKQDSIWLWAYCCLPMTALEVSGQAHVDGLLLAPLGWLIWLIARGKHRLAAVPIVVLGAIKILPLVLALPLGAMPAKAIAANGNARARCFGARFYAVLIALSLVVWFPLFTDYATWRIYWHHASLMTAAFQFNGGVYYALCYACEALQIKDFWLFTPTILSVIRFCVVLVVGGVGVRIQKNRYQTVVYMLAVFSMALLISAKVHSWYFLPLLLMNGIVGWKWLYVLASGSMLSYSYYAVYPNQEQYGIEMLVWGIAVCIGLCEYFGAYYAVRRYFRKKAAIENESFVSDLEVRK